MVLLKNPSSIIRIYDAGGGDTKVSFSLIITLGKEEIPLIQIRVKKESYMGTSLKLSGERGDYTRWLVVKALMEKKIPILSTGGGV